MQIRKKWLNQYKNIFKNIIWHLFAGESHQVVKITVPYPTVSPPPPRTTKSVHSRERWTMIMQRGTEENAAENIIDYFFHGRQQIFYLLLDYKSICRIIGLPPGMSWMCRHPTSA